MMNRPTYDYPSGYFRCTYRPLKMSEQTLTLKEKIAIMQAASYGSVIEQRHRKAGVAFDQWYLSDDPEWDWSNFEYRVKREPRKFYVPCDKDGNLVIGAAYPSNADFPCWGINQHVKVIEFVEVLKDD